MEQRDKGRQRLGGRCRRGEGREVNEERGFCFFWKEASQSTSSSSLLTSSSSSSMSSDAGTLAAVARGRSGFSGSRRTPFSVALPSSPSTTSSGGGGGGDGSRRKKVGRPAANGESMPIEKGKFMPIEGGELMLEARGELVGDGGAG